MLLHHFRLPHFKFLNKTVSRFLITLAVIGGGGGGLYRHHFGEGWQLICG